MKYKKYASMEDLFKELKVGDIFVWRRYKNDEFIYFILKFDDIFYSIKCFCNARYASTSRPKTFWITNFGLYQSELKYFQKIIYD